jgi:hypothetical protein
MVRNVSDAFTEVCAKHEPNYIEEIYETVLVHISYLKPLIVPSGSRAVPLRNTRQTAHRTERTLYVFPDTWKI